MEEISWYQLPLDLQAQFYKKAEEDSEKILSNLKETFEKLNKLKDFLNFDFKKIDFSDISLKIGAIDGSKSVNLSNRLGLKVAVFSGCAIILKENERKERFMAGSLKEKQLISDESSKYRLSLLLTYLERKLALEILNEVDYLIIDGSFYGFVYPILRLKKEGLFSESIKKILTQVFELTNKLVESKKAISVVKRSRTRVIGAHIFLKYDDPSFVDFLDRFILSYFMPKESMLDYREIIELKGENGIQIYNQISSLSKKVSKNEIFEIAKEKAYEPFNSLSLNLDHFKKLSRIQVKSHENVATCEIEHPSMDIEELKKIVSSKNFFNASTGLPLALDIADNLVSLPLSFTEDYVTEVEARAIYKALNGNMPIEVLKILFMNMNPQKR